MDISALLVNCTLLSDLQIDEVFSFFHYMPIKADYLSCQHFNDYAMDYSQVILDYECATNKVIVTESPSFPNAGKGLVNNRTEPISKGTGLPYWGQVFVQDFVKQPIQDVDLDDKYQERLVELSFQPFLHIGLRLYLLGSLSCAASYSNDADFKGWSDSCERTTGNLNNCFLREYSPLDEKTVKGLSAWLLCCPVWIIASARIKYGEEFLTKYF